jgi:hypothetical protein
VADLQACQRSLGVNDVGQPGQSREVVAARRAKLALERFRSVVVDVGVLDDHEPDAAAGNSAVVPDEALGHGSVGSGEQGRLRRLQDPVLRRERADPARREQVRKEVAHPTRASVRRLRRRKPITLASACRGQWVMRF